MDTTLHEKGDSRMKTKSWIGPVAASLSVLLVLLGGWTFVSAMTHPSGPLSHAGGGTAGWGFGGMLGFGQNARLSLDSRFQLAQLVRQGERGAVINRLADSVSYSGKNVTLVALASPHGEPNMTWEIDGLVNPTVRVPAGADVRVVLVNTDWGYMHGFELTTTSPPYSFMAMMDINSDFLLMPLPERTTQALSTARYPVRSGQPHLSAGTYHYLCPVPGHAEQGMYGTLKVV